MQPCDESQSIESDDPLCRKAIRFRDIDRPFTLRTSVLELAEATIRETRKRPSLGFDRGVVALGGRTADGDEAVERLAQLAVVVQRPGCHESVG